MKISKQDLIDTIRDLVDRDPLNAATGLCHYCEAPVDNEHTRECPWTNALALLEGNDEYTHIRVGEDEAEFRERVEDGEDEDDVAARAFEEMEKIARSAKRSRAVPVDDLKDEPELVGAPFEE